MKANSIVFLQGMSCPLNADVCAGGVAAYALSQHAQTILRADPLNVHAVTSDPAFARCRSSAGVAAVCEVRAIAQPLGHNSPNIILTYYVAHRV